MKGASMYRFAWLEHLFSVKAAPRPSGFLSHDPLSAIPLDGCFTPAATTGCFNAQPTTARLSPPFHLMPRRGRRYAGQ